MTKTKTKDPAVLWYYQAYMFGTRHLTFEEKGVYNELLNEQADRGALDFRDGYLTEIDLQNILEKELQNRWIIVWNKVKNKFTEKDGKFFNERMRAEQSKRQGYCKSRSKNGKHKKTIREAHADHTGKNAQAYATNQINTNQIKSNNLLKKEETTTEETSTPLSDIQVFDAFRYAYPGIKRGLETEFNHFKKKNPNWKEILPQLMPALANQKTWRPEMTSVGMFVPDWRWLKTWIHQRGWEDQKPVIIHRPQFKRAPTATEADIAAQAERVTLV